MFPAIFFVVTATAITTVALFALASGVELPRITLKQSAKGARRFVDAYGRERFFHGVNAVTKGPPWIPVTDSFSIDISMHDNDFQLMQKLGLNVVRLGAMWPGIEPTRGSYNETYLEEVRKIVQTASAYGVYVLLDMHEDVLSEKFCGEGIPVWAVRNDSHRHVFGSFPSPLAAPFNDSQYYPEPLSGGAHLPNRQVRITNALSFYILSPKNQ